MLTITDAARQALHNSLADDAPTIVRINLTGSGCSGSFLDLRPNAQPAESDVLFTQDGFEFCIDKALLEQIQSVTLDFKDKLFELSTAAELPDSNDTCCGRCWRGNKDIKPGGRNAWRVRKQFIP